MLPKILVCESVPGWKPQFQLEFCCNEGLFYSQNQQTLRASPKAGTELGNSSKHPTWSFLSQSPWSVEEVSLPSKRLQEQDRLSGLWFAHLSRARTVHGYLTSQGCWVIMSSLWRCPEASAKDAMPWRKDRPRPLSWQKVGKERMLAQFSPWSRMKQKPDLSLISGVEGVTRCTLSARTFL